MMVLMAGLPGTGKTTLCGELSRKVAGAVISKDALRHALFSPDDIEYSTQQDDFCQSLMLQAAAFLLRRNSQRWIFLDGRTFSRRYQIDQVLAFAAEIQQPWRIIECTCSEETAKRRLEAAEQGQHPAGNRDYALYQALKARFEPISQPKTLIDSDQPLDVCIARAQGGIGADSAL